MNNKTEFTIKSGSYENIFENGSKINSVRVKYL